MNTCLHSEDFLCENLSQNEEGHLLFAGMDTVALAKEYGTPLYLMDENRIRTKCRAFRSAVETSFGKNAKVLYASKAASFKRIYEIMNEENLGVDVVSVGEIQTAATAKFPLGNAYFHSNNKTDADIAFAMDHGVGYFVADNAEELEAIEKIAKDKKINQKVLLRLTPGIDPHTYDAVATGKVDSKFGSAIETGQAEEIFRLAVSLPHVDLCGFHCHVGSQVFDPGVHIRASKIMLDFVALLQRKYGFTTKELDMGGGFGVRYTKADPTLDIGKVIGSLAEHMKTTAKELGIPLPAVRIEPGRSIVADAGLTLYTVGTLKKIPGYKTYVSVDGGMTDNIRFALYHASYTVLVANKMNEECSMTASVVGRCCESGDVIQENVNLPASTKRNDLIATLTTGAYHYSMASNYNRIPRPPVVFLANGTSYVAVRRETPEDLIRLDN